MITTTRPKATFSDINSAYDIAGNPYAMVFDEQALNNAIVSILSTRRGSRVFRRNFGSNVMDLLFDPIGTSTATSLKFEIISSLEDWEPRIKLTSATVIPDFANQLYYVEIGYIIPSLNNKQVAFKFNLDPKSATGAQ